MVARRRRALLPALPALLIGLGVLRLKRRQIGWTLVGLAAIAPLWRLWLDAGGASTYRLYVSTDTRYDGLLLGAALALLANPAFGDRAPLGLSHRTIDRVVTPIALVVFLAGSLAPNPYRLTVVDSVLYLCLIPIFWTLIASSTGLLGRALNQRWVAHIGVLSFSVYLLHRLFLGMAHELPLPDVLVDVIAFIVTMIAAQVVYMLVERPLADVRKRLEGRTPSSDSTRRAA